MENPVFHFRQGTQPLLISIPHLGTVIPDEIGNQYLDVAGMVADTDWHLDRVYRFAESMGASILSAKYSRYAIDLNRPPSGESLYPGQTTTGLCPIETFRGEPLYRDSGALNDAELRLSNDTKSSEKCIKVGHFSVFATPRQRIYLKINALEKIDVKSSCLVDRWAAEFREVG